MPGIIPALYQLGETLCTKDEKVLINTPVYCCFLHAAEYLAWVNMAATVNDREDKQRRRADYGDL